MKQEFTRRMTAIILRNATKEEECTISVLEQSALWLNRKTPVSSAELSNLLSYLLN